jgi:DNA polymerase-3 subunit delta
MTDNQIKPVYYFYGPEDLLIEHEIARIKSKALSGGFASMNLGVFDGASLDADALVMEAMTYPAMSPMRVLVVSNAQSIKEAQIERIVEYIKNPSLTTVLIFASTEKKVDKRAAFMKLLDSKGCLRVFYNPRGDELTAWMRKEAGRLGKKISASAAARLADIAGPKLRDVAGELAKIALFTGDKAGIELSDVESAGVDVREESAFDLAEAILGKDLKRALTALSKLEGEPPLTLIGAIAGRMRALVKLKSLSAKGMEGERLAAACGIFMNKLAAYRKASSRLTQKETRRIFRRLSRADMDFKGGLLPDRVKLTALVMDLCKKA